MKTKDKKLKAYTAPSIKMERVELEEGFLVCSVKMKVNPGNQNGQIKHDWGQEQQQTGDINWLG